MAIMTTGDVLGSSAGYRSRAQRLQCQVNIVAQVDYDQLGRERKQTA